MANRKYRLSLHPHPSKKQDSIRTDFQIEPGGCKGISGQVKKSVTMTGFFGLKLVVCAIAMWLALACLASAKPIGFFLLYL